MAACSLLSDAEQQDYNRLADWFTQSMAHNLPLEAYAIRCRPVLVSDPGRSHAWIADRISRGCSGQVQRALLVRLRELWEMFGEGE